MITRNRVRLLAGLLLAVLLAGLPAGLLAAPSAQGGQLIKFADPVRGTLDATTAQQTYQFTCKAQDVLSVVVETLSGDLVPVLAVYDAAGRLLAEGASTGQGVAAQAFIPTADGVCAATVSRASGSGDYSIQLLGGFADLTTQDFFDNAADPLRLRWEPYDGETVDGRLVGEQLEITVSTDNMTGYISPEDERSWTDFYMQADVVIPDAPSYYEYGFIFYMSDDGEAFQTLTYSSDSDWSLYAYDAGWTAIQDYTVHPDIDGADQSPQIGILVQDGVLRAYFNGTFIAETPIGDGPREGLIAMTATTIADQTDILTVYFDNLFITEPLDTGGALPFGQGQDEGEGQDQGQGEDDNPLLGVLSATNTPEQVAPPPTDPPPPPPPTEQATDSANLSNWQSDQPSVIVGELQALGLVPASGSVVLNVPTSFGDTSAPGWSFYPLGRGNTFHNFVLVFDARLINTGPGSGCGMHFRDNAQSSSTAMVFEEGAAFLGQFDTTGDPHPASIYDTFPAVNAGQGAINRVIVVAEEETIAMWVNGQFFGVGEFSAQTGEVALEVFVNEDDFGRTQQTYCQLDNIWIWEF